MRLLNSALSAMRKAIMMRSNAIAVHIQTGRPRAMGEWENQRYVSTIAVTWPLADQRVGLAVVDCPDGPGRCLNSTGVDLQFGRPGGT